MVSQGSAFKAELPYWLVINRCKGIGPKRFAALLQKNESLLNFFNDRQPRAEFLQQCRQWGVTFIADWAGVEKDLRWAQQPSCHILPLHHPAYPEALKAIADPPPLLFVQGDPVYLNQPQVALVGSRRPTTQGRQSAFQFAQALVEQGLMVTSGLALGIDTASHEGALAAKGGTIAVLGNSLESIYPVQNKALARLIAEQGALVSEFPLGTPPLAEHFPRRNRIISGLSLGVLVVESTLKSGSLITAQYALEQGREVFALPGSRHNPMAKGCNHLIRQGAKCVEDITHILEDLPLGSNRSPSLASSTVVQRRLTPPLAVKNDLSTEQRYLINQIDEICTPVDLIVNRTGLTPEKVCSMLLELELQGHLAAIPGGYVRVMTNGKAL